MPKRIPVSSLKKFAKEQKLTMAILLAWDGQLTHVVTWGQSLEECAKAADAGNSLKTAIGWPDSLHAQPSRVRKLQERIKKLEDEIKGREV